MSPPLFVLALGLGLGLATDSGSGSRSIDPSVPTSVPAPSGVEVTEPVTPAPGADDDDDDPSRRATSGDAPRPTSPVTKRPPAPPKPAPSSEGKPRRRGGLVMAAVGVAGCGQDQCEAIKVMPWFGVTGGYRFGRFAPILTVQGGAVATESPFAVANDSGTVVVPSKEDRSFFHVGAGTLLHLLASTRFDPYFGLTIGYLQTRVRMRGSAELPDGTALDFNAIERVGRGALGIVLGLGFRIRERWTLGPRVDVLVPFAGEQCVRSPGGKPTCIELDKVEQIDPGQFFPRPWAAMLQVGAYL